MHTELKSQIWGFNLPTIERVVKATGEGIHTRIHMYGGYRPTLTIFATAVADFRDLIGWPDPNRVDGISYEMKPSQVRYWRWIRGERETDGTTVIPDQADKHPLLKKAGILFRE